MRPDALREGEGSADAPAGDAAEGDAAAGADAGVHQQPSGSSVGGRCGRLLDAWESSFAGER